MTSGDKLLKMIYLARHTQWQYALENYTVKSLNIITKSLDKARNEFFNEIFLNNIVIPKGRRDNILNELNDLTFGIQHQLTGDIAEAAKTAGKFSYHEYGQIMSLNGRLADTVGFNFIQLSPNQLHAMVVDVPVGGKLLKNWVADNFKRQIVDEIQTDIMAGMFKGDSTRKLVNRLKQSFNGLNHEAITLTRTYIADINNRAAESVYKANSDIIKEEEWSASLSNHTCFRCIALDGQTWPLMSDHPRPPIHHRCRCFLLPQTKSFLELGLNIDELEKTARPFTIRNGVPINDGGKAKIIDFGMFEGTGAEWAKRQSPKTLKQIMGAGRKSRFDAGLVDFKDLIDKKGNVILIKDLPELSGLDKLSDVKKSNLSKIMMQDSEKLLLPKMKKTGREYMVAYDTAGKQIFQKAGGKKSISFSYDDGEKLKGTNFFHSHPNDSSFSSEDIVTAKLLKVKSMNVVSDKYNYTLKPKATKTWNDSKNIKKEYNDLKSFHMIIGQDDYEKLLSSGVNDTIAQRTAWVKVTHRINIDLAEKFNLDYERISRK